MIFSEVYGCYYSTVAAILKEAVKGELTLERLRNIVQEHAFGESVLTIPTALQAGEWPLLRKDLTTPLKNGPSMPLTFPEKQWLKAILADPRIRLFFPEEDSSGILMELADKLKDVEPLYEPGTFIYFDRYSDGDPYEDGDYIRNFRIILKGLKEKRKIRVRFSSGHGNIIAWVLVPQYMEYSSKDDKFRLVSSCGGQPLTVNMGRIHSCELLDTYSAAACHPISYREDSLTFELTDERNALERVMLHFSHLEKETEKIDGRHYRVTIHYRHEDETEILIRILSFGPMVRVVSPESFIEQIRERLTMQASLMKPVLKE